MGEEKIPVNAWQDIWHRYCTPATRHLLVVLAVAAASVWIRTGFPVYAIGASFDDLLFVVLARCLHSGQWLGQYNQLTLAKGMFYPAFVAFAHSLGVPLKIAEQICYLVASGLTAELVRRRTGNNTFAALLFALLAFNPVVWNKEFARVIREGLYLSLPLAIVVLFVMVVFPRHNRGRLDRLWRVAPGISLGLVGAAFWLTREEGVWILPSLGIVLLIGAVRFMQPGVRSNLNQENGKLNRSAWIDSVALALGLAVLSFAAADFLVAGLNYRNYGIFETNEMRARSFLRAYGAVTRIRHDHWQPYVSFPLDARERAYRVSSAARELKPQLDGGLGEYWRGISCGGKAVSLCPEVSDAFFLWEFRAAVSNSGHYQSGAETMRFYDTLADQLDAACASGAIACLPNRASLAPPFRMEYLREMVQPGQVAAKLLLTLRDGPLGTPLSQAIPPDVELFSDMVGPVRPSEVTSPAKRVFEGWAAAPSGKPTLLWSGPERYQSSVIILPAADVIAQNPKLSAVRFRLETTCPLQLCALIVEASGQKSPIRLYDMIPGHSIESPVAQLRIENVISLGEVAAAEAPLSAQVRIASFIAPVYAFGVPVLTGVGMLGFLLAVGLGTLGTFPSEILALGLASLVAVGTRIALLAYITASSFPAANFQYSATASPFVLIFGATGIYLGWCALLGRYRARL